MTVWWPFQFMSRCCLTTPSIFPTYFFKDSGFKNIPIAPLTLLWSSPLNSVKLLSPNILLIGWGCWFARITPSLVNMNLFAAAPLRRTVGVPKRLSLDTAPYFWILLWSHFSPVFFLRACKKLKLWPMMGMPREPGGSFWDTPLLSLRKSMMKIGRRKINRRLKIDIAVLLMAEGHERQKVVKLLQSKNVYLLWYPLCFRFESDHFLIWCIMFMLVSSFYLFIFLLLFLLSITCLFCLLLYYMYVCVHFLVWYIMFMLVSSFYLFIYLLLFLLSITCLFCLIYIYIYITFTFLLLIWLYRLLVMVGNIFISNKNVF